MLFYILSSFWVGAVHAATPGHGKTIAAAYIVGARGKPIDALILGIFVTLSHTTGIILVGVLASLGSTWLQPQRIETHLALATGLIVVGLGLWMLWQQRELLALAMGDVGANGRGTTTRIRTTLSTIHTTTHRLTITITLTRWTKISAGTVTDGAPVIPIGWIW